MEVVEFVCLLAVIVVVALSGIAEERGRQIGFYRRKIERLEQELGRRPKLPMASVNTALRGVEVDE